MAQIIRMPSVLAGSEEAAIANWLVTEGQRIEVGEPLAEIETEKAIVEYNAEEAGIVGRVVLAAGESGEIGAPIAVLIAEGETAADIDAALGGSPAAEPDAAATGAPAAPTAPTAAPETGAATASPASEAPSRDPESAAPVTEAASVTQAAADADTLDPAASTTATATTTGSPTSAASASAGATASGLVGQSGTAGAPDQVGAPDHAAPTASATGGESGDRLFVSPIARKLARQQGLDPSAIAGSGPGGRIVRRDVEAALAAGTATAGSAASATAATAVAAGAPAATSAQAAPAASATAAPGASPTGDWDLIPHTGMRRAIARRLTESKSTVPHFYLTAEPRVDALLALRAEVNAQSPVRVSVNDFVVKAVAAAFADVPEANVTWSDEGMRKHHSVDIAVAVATEGGLVTPVVRGVDTKSLTAVSSTIGELVAKAKDKRLKQDELEGGSFSVSNLGMYGTVEFSAILNPPQSGILAVGAAKQQAVVIDGELAVATVMRCTLSVDHRAVDGALAAQWLAAFTKRIENPLSILL